MANYVNIALDTNAPANPSVTINTGATYSNDQLVTLTIGTSDGTTTGYQMKIWGTVDTANDTSVQDTEVNSQWISFNTSKQVKVSAGDGSKSISVKIRDDVWNESTIVTDTITLNTSLPSITVGSPDVSKISKITGKNTVSFTISSVDPYDEYKVKVVTSISAIESTGVLVPVTNGSTNTSGIAGNYTSPITVTIKGADLELASSGDGTKIVKVFIKNSAGTWSV